MEKFRKALTKVQDDKAVEFKTTRPAPVARQKGRKDPSWVSPVYSQSRKVALDKARALASRCVGLAGETHPAMEHYKVLRTRIEQQMEKNKWNTLMITSPRKQEGKTVCSVNLAAAFARQYNRTVLLVDADLKDQPICRYLGLDTELGLIDYLLHGRPLRDIIVWPEVGGFTLISGGQRTPDGTEVLSSPRMQDLVQDMKQRYRDRYIVFDVPAILDRADAMAFAPLVDCIALVVEYGKTSMNDIRQALELIPRERFLGFILNRSPESIRN